ncbi:sensor histidine kinase [Actinocrispum sp. NPDC049592]|uniref:sensor histidine kinase n=1 Tax=Actinocrispum sp. NPDC049592 TaxID=3154835 RepID=UPI00342AB539
MTSEGWQRPGPTRAEQRRDLWIGLVILVSALLMLALANSAGIAAMVSDRPPAIAEQIAWCAAVTVPLGVRRRYPLAVLIIVCAVFIAAMMRGLGENVVSSIAVFLAMYTAGAWERNRTAARWWRITAIVAMFALLAYNMTSQLLHQQAPQFPGAAGPLDPLVAAVLYNIVFNGMFFLGAYFFGNVGWVTACQQAELEHRAEQLRAAQEQNTRGAIVAERVRIARDLHDVVAHHVSVMGVQASAARRVLDKDHDVASEALRNVEQTARVAIGELRGLLGVLRADDSADASAPFGLDQVPDLVSATRSAGIEVRYGVYGDTRPVPQAVALSAYRVVQEALTNVVKHSGARQADVRLRYLDNTLEVEIADDGHGTQVQPDRGFGLLGIRERVAVHGGEVEAGPRRDGGFRVRATFPSTQDMKEFTAP